MTFNRIVFILRHDFYFPKPKCTLDARASWCKQMCQIGDFIHLSSNDVCVYQNLLSFMPLVLTYLPPFSFFVIYSNSGLILGLRPANERRRYKVTPPLINWAQI